MGGDLGVYHQKSEGAALSLTSRGLLATRFQYFSRSFDFQNLDAIGGLALGYRKAQDAFEVFLGHQSSHLGDDVLDQGLMPFAEVSFEFLRVLYAREIPELGRFYGGAEYIFRAEPTHWRGDLGFHLGLEAYPFQSGFFSALDIQLLERTDYDVDLSIVLGQELHSRSRYPNPIRLFLEFYRGRSYLGQFSKVKETYVLLGMGFTY